jgi:hypothetical protein
MEFADNLLVEHSNRYSDVLIWFLNCNVIVPMLNPVLTGRYSSDPGNEETARQMFRIVCASPQLFSFDITCGNVPLRRP